MIADLTAVALHTVHPLLNYDTLHCRERALRRSCASYETSQKALVVALPVFFAALLSLLTVSASPAHPAPREVFVDTSPSVRIHIRVAGPNNAKPPLVFVPGWRLTASIWQEQVATFSKDRRVIVVDPRSQGESTKTPEGDTPEQRARDLDAVLKQQKAAPIVLVGWSQGVQDVAAYVEQFGQ